MVGYIGSKASVTQVDGYNQAEADAEFVNDPNGAITVDGSNNVGIGTSSPTNQLHVASTADSSIRVSAGGSGDNDAKLVLDGNGSGVCTIDADKHLTFTYSGTERMRIDSSGNVGIGTSSPTTPTHITKGDLSGFVSRTAATLTLENSGDTELYLASSPTNTGQIRFGDTGGNFRGAISYDHSSDAFLHYTNGSEAMRIDSSGDLHVAGNVIAYSTTISDERLKTDIVKIDGALDKVAQLNGYTFTYTADGKKSAGVIAQEVQKVLPSAIVESTLPLKMGDDDETEYMTVQYDQLMGLMIEAIKELKAEVAELKGS